MTGPKGIFIAGIGTDIGKTVVSAILAEKYVFNYWKPIQAGNLDQSDSMTVESLLSNGSSRVLPEVYRCNQPYSPHRAAKLDHQSINLSSIKIPPTSRPIICEGAGGLMVPLNEDQTNLDLIRHLQFPLILVVRNYLGSINHTLLSLAKIHQEGFRLLGLVYTGEANPDSESIIERLGKVKTLGKIAPLNVLSAESIRQAGSCIHLNVNDL